MFHSVKTAFSKGNITSATTAAGAIFAVIGGGTYVLDPGTPIEYQLFFYVIGICLFLLKEVKTPKKP